MPVPVAEKCLLRADAVAELRHESRLNREQRESQNQSPHPVALRGVERPGWLYPDRIAGRDRHHRHSRGNAPPGAIPGQGASASDRLRKQPKATDIGQLDVLG